MLPDAAAPRPSNLPSDVTSFVGRRQIGANLKSMVTSARLVTLTGPGGVGKTRLALRAANSARNAFPDGVWFVELAALKTPALLVSTVSKALGLRGTGHEDTLHALMDFLSERRVLVVLDNCEHLIDGCNELLTTLLRACPYLRILATSRQALGCAGEHVLSVPPLSVPNDGPATVAASMHTESVSLFVDRARAATGQFNLTEDNVDDVVAICRHLEGIPLALELAAVRLRGLAPAQILRLLQDRFQLLTSGPRGGAERQRTLQNCIDWSFELCTRGEQELWTSLAVFSGGFELDAVYAINPNQSREELVDGLLSLVEKSILIREEQSGQVRYQMLGMLQQYAEQKVATSERRDALQRLHRDFYAGLAAGARSKGLPGQQLSWFHRMHREHSNFRAALLFCLDSGDGTEAGMVMATRLLNLWSTFGPVSEGIAWLERFLAASPDPTLPRFEALHAVVWLHSISGGHERGGRYLHEMEELDTLLDGTARTLAVQARGIHALYSDNLGGALEYLEEAAAGFRAEGDDYHLLQTLGPLGVAHDLAGLIDRGMAFHRECMEVSERTADVYFRAFSLATAGLLAFHNGEPIQAARHVQDSLRLKLLLDDRLGIAMCLDSLAVITTSSNPHRAAVLLGSARAAYAAIGVPSDALPGRGQRLEACERTLRATLSPKEMHKLVNKGLGLAQDARIAFGLDESGADEQTERSVEPRRETLTRREREVAALIAEGLTNREIANRLVISQRTAESHVDHILVKLGFNTRAQVASWFESLDSRQPN